MTKLENIKKHVLNYIDKEKSYIDELFSFFLAKEIDEKFDFSQISYGGAEKAFINIRSRFTCQYLWYQENNDFFPIGFFINKVGGCFSPKFEYGRLYLGNICLEGIREKTNYLEIFNGRKLLGSYAGSGFYGEFQCHDSVFSGSIKIPHTFLRQECSPGEKKGTAIINGTKKKFLISANYFPSKKKVNETKWAFTPQDKYPNIFLDIPATSYAFDENLLLLYLFCRSYTYLF